jgi:hypothetical protein
VGLRKRGDASWADRCQAFLKQRGILVASRFGALRVAPYVHNTHAHVQSLIDAVADFEAFESETAGQASKQS